MTAVIYDKEQLDLNTTAATRIHDFMVVVLSFAQKCDIKVLDGILLTNLRDPFK